MAETGRRIACVDLGASEVKVEVLEFVIRDGKVLKRRIAHAKFATTQKPNRPMEDWSNLCRVLWSLKRQYGFDGVSVGIAAIVRHDGTIALGGSLNWGGYMLGTMITAEFGVPCVLDNDAVMFAAYELVFGVLANPQFGGRSFFDVVYGTGIGTSKGYRNGKGHLLVASECQHNWYDRSQEPNGCNCEVYCYESACSGSGLRRQRIVPEDLDEAADVAYIAPVLGRLIATTVRDSPGIELAVVSGHVPHKRKSLVGAIQKVADDELGVYAGTLEVVRGSDGAGGTVGCLAYWILHFGLLG